MNAINSISKDDTQKGFDIALLLQLLPGSCVIASMRKVVNRFPCHALLEVTNDGCIFLGLFSSFLA